MGKRIAIWLALAVPCGVSAARLAVLALSSAATWQGDFSAYLAAAHALRVAPHANVYALVTIAPYGLVAVPALGLPPYVYPPLCAVLLIPLTWLPLPVAFALWLAVNLAVWAVCAAWLVRLMPPPWRPLALVLALCFVPMLLSVYVGQINGLVLVGILAALALADCGRLRTAGIVLGVIAAVKLYPVVLIGYFLLRREWRVAGAAILTGVVLTAATLPFTGLAIIGAYARALAAFSVVTARNPANAAILPHGPLAVLTVALCAVVWGLAVARYRDADIRLGYGWTLPLMLLLTPLVWNHYYVWLLPTFAYLLAYGVRRPIVVALALIYLPLAIIPDSMFAVGLFVLPLYAVAGGCFLASSARARWEWREVRTAFIRASSVV